MIRVFLSFLLLSALPLFATQYNSTVLELEAKLFPKIILLNDNIDKKVKNLQIFIISKKIDFDTAYELQKSIEFYYPDTLMGKKIFIHVQEFEKFTILPDALIVLYHENKILQEIALWANTHKVVTLGYDPYYMDYGILGSLYIGKNTKPYLNKKVIQKYNFTFNPYLLELSKFR
jgi:hypothetical protein